MEIMNKFEIYRQQKNVPGMQVYVMKNGEKMYSSNHSAKGVKI